MKHVTQALEYEGIIKQHRPNIQFTTYVVGTPIRRVRLSHQRKAGASRPPPLVIRGDSSEGSRQIRRDPCDSGKVDS